MAPRVVRAGEHLDVIAYRHGVTPDEIWNASANQALKARRIGGNLLMAGDALELPERRHPQPAALTIGAENVFVATIPKVPVELTLIGNGRPMVGERWHIEARGEQAKGATGSDGKVIFEVRVTTSHLTLVLDQRGHRLNVVVGGLDPADSMAGVAQRLRNLGFDPGSSASELTPELSNALMQFQRARNMTPSGQADSETMRELAIAHGS